MVFVTEDGLLYSCVQKSSRYAYFNLEFDLKSLNFKRDKLEFFNIQEKTWELELVGGEEPFTESCAKHIIDYLNNTYIRPYSFECEINSTTRCTKIVEDLVNALPIGLWRISVIEDFFTDYDILNKARRLS
ncbi:hypothetical protein L596_022633 [Steinernema carpocapsae]|uniref:Uncharacterized protein n=1 Tax=Steinernema carpocapsae TaxID=34508 RepID=A0A4U5MMP2_STECR|nr:hypothetical protein L596_022633 [Steinernema carpocapsae]